MYHGTYYHDLVEHLGVNRASMYHTYGDKHELYQKALLVYYCDKNQQQLKELLRSPIPFREKLDQLLTAVIEETLGDCQQKGELAPGQSAEALVHFLFNNYLGLKVMAKLQPARKHLEQIKDLLLANIAWA